MAREKYLFEKPFFGEGESFVGQLKDVPEKEIDEIINAFKEGEPIISLKEQYPYFTNRTFALQLPFILTENQCARCKGPVYKRLTRIPGSNVINFEDGICAECGHNGKPRCQCKYCVQEDQEFWDDYIKKNYSDPKSTENLTVFDEINLYILIENYFDKERNSLKFEGAQQIRRSYYSEHRSFLPSEFASTIHNFIDRQILIPNKKHNRHLIRQDWNGEAIVDLNPAKVFWILNLKNEKGPVEISEYYNTLQAKVFSDQDKSLLWREIYYKEVKQYTQYYVDQYLKIELENIYYDYITDVLITDYSISQAYAQIYYAITATLRYQAKYDPPKSKLNSNFRNNLMRNVNRYDSRSARNFDRPNFIDLSLKSSFIISNILNIKGNQGYFYSPTKEILPGYQSIDEQV